MRNMTEELLRITIEDLAQKGESLELAKLRLDLAIIIKKQRLKDGIKIGKNFLPIEYRIGKFWAKVKTGNVESCWPWLGGRSVGKSGEVYGFTSNINRKLKTESYLAHKFAYLTTGNTIPRGYVVCHKCDNTLCVNPGHLFCGTQQDNVLDMISKNKAWFQKTEGLRL